MKLVTRVSCFDGMKSYAPGDTVEGDSEFTRGLLANGLADPADEQAKELSRSDSLARYRSDALSGAAGEVAKVTKKNATKKGGKK